MGADVQHVPAVSVTVPPASVTSTAPAAMSHTWMPASWYTSAAPEATRHMLSAQEPIERNLRTNREERTVTSEAVPDWSELQMMDFRRLWTWKGWMG